MIERVRVGQRGRTPLSLDRWRKVPGWPRYEVSTFGHIRRKSYYILDKRGVRQFIKARYYVHKLTNKDRYSRIILKGPDSCKSESIHIIVLTTFIGPRPNGKKGLHRDDDKSNNKLSNLYWGTDTDNANDAVRNGHHRNGTQGKRHSPETIAKMRKARKQWHQARGFTNETKARMSEAALRRWHQ